MGPKERCSLHVSHMHGTMVNSLCLLTLARLNSVMQEFIFFPLHLIN